jgi:hypothetical protein
LTIKFIFSFVILLFLGKVFSQSNFPVSWLGVYKGNLIIASNSGIQDTVPVEFHFLPTKEKNRWTYRMIYNSPKWGRMVKDYELFWNDSLKNPNTFILDEKDGILIQETFLNGKFCAHFEVDGSHFVSTLERKGKKNLFFEIRCSDVKNGMKTTSNPDPSGKIHTIQNLHLYSVQYAEFKPFKYK